MGHGTVQMVFLGVNLYFIYHGTCNWCFISWFRCFISWFRCFISWFSGQIQQISTRMIVTCMFSLIEEKHACLSKESYFYESTLKKLDFHLYFYSWYMYLNKRRIENCLFQRSGNIFEALVQRTDMFWIHSH